MERIPTDVHQLMETVLVVDDNPQNRLLIDGQLSSVGYTVTCASSGEEALSLFSRYTPDLILLDIMMPHLNGFETFRRLRQLPGGPETPIVFLTAAADPATHKTALDLGADDFLSKPVNRTELLIRVRSLLRVRRLHSELRTGNEILRTQRDTLLRVQQQKDELAAFVVHDLNSSLTNISLLTEQLKLDSGLGADVRLILSDIANATHAVHRKVMNLLDISRSEDGALVPRMSQLDLGALVRRVCHGYAELVRQRRQSLRCQADDASCLVEDRKSTRLNSSH